MLRPSALSSFTRLRRDPASRHLAEAVLTAVVVEVALRLVALPRLADAVGASIDLVCAGDAPAEPAAVLGPADAARLRASHIVMQRWPFGACGPCLRLALVAGRMLRHRRPRIALGATRGEHGPAAHAWLLVDGLALDADAARWTPLLMPGAA
jgi:Transglutaminase-like superfamily